MTETVIRAETEPPAEGTTATDETPIAEESPIDQETPVDEELLAEAGRGLGTTSRNAIINGALRDYVERKRDDRREALQDLRKMSDEGLFDYDALDEVDK